MDSNMSKAQLPSRPHNSFLEDEPQDAGLKHEEERDRSRMYLNKCIEEFAYHVFSSVNTQQQYAEESEPMLQNHQYQNHRSHPQQPSLEDVYVQNQQRQRNNAALAPSPLPNHQPPPLPRVSEAGSHPRGSQPPEDRRDITRIRELRQAQQQAGPPTAVDRSNRDNTEYGFPNSEGSLEKVAHSYDSYGRPVPSRNEESDQTRISEEPELTEADGWNFDDPPEAPVPHEDPVPEYSSTPQRPDTDVFPSANSTSMKSPTRSQKRKSSLSQRRQSDGSHELRELSMSHTGGGLKGDLGQFKVRFALRGHLDVVRSVIFTGGGSPSAPEICTAGDDGVIKRWIAASAPQKGDDLDLRCDQTHRGHTGAVLCLAAAPTYQPFSNGGRAQGDGWVFSGGEDRSVRVWERGRVDPKATLDGHTDAVWTVCVLPGTSGSVLGDSSAHHGGLDRTLLASGGADGTILVWAISTPPQVSSPHTGSGSRRGGGRSGRANSVSSGSNFPNSPQPSTASTRPFQHSLIHRIERVDHPSPTCISPLSMSGDTFVVSFADASVLVYSTRTGEEIVGMASLVAYDGTTATGVNAVVATTVGVEGSTSFDSGRGAAEDEALVHGATGSSNGVEGMIYSGHEDRHIRFFDANSGKCIPQYPEIFTKNDAPGQCTYDMLAHPAAISSLSLSPSGSELVSAGHDASLRFWSLEKRSCTQEITSHRLMRGEGVCSVVWSQDGRWVVSGGGDGVVKVFSRMSGEQSRQV